MGGVKPYVSLSGTMTMQFITSHPPSEKEAQKLEILNGDTLVLLLAFLNDAKMKCFPQVWNVWHSGDEERLRPFLGA